MRQNYLRAAAGYRINQPAVDGDEHIANTELLLKGEGTNGQTNNTFVDSSASSHSITRYNDVTQGSFSPFSPKGWSMYVDGTQIYGGVGLAGFNTLLGTGTGDWTIEFWYKFDGFETAAGTSTILPLVNNYFYGFGYGSFYSYVRSDRKVQFNSGSTSITSTTALSIGSWCHIALVNDNGTLRLYINGVQEGSGSAPSSFDTTGYWIVAGRWYNVTSATAASIKYGKGYFSNIRVNDDCLYPNGTTFSTPTQPLTATANTQALGFQDNRFKDNSSNNHSYAVYNGAHVKPTSPFSGNREYPKASYFSGEFDGSNDYLRCDTALDDFTNTSNNFTIEAWFNSRVSPSTFKAIFGVNYDQGRENNLVVGVRDASGTPKISFHKHLTTGSTTTDENYGSFELNTWNHIAATYDGSSVKLYLNGTQIHSVSGAYTRTLSTCSFCIGAELDIIGGVTNYPGNYFDGYISNVRVVKDVLYTTSFTPPTAPLTPVANTKLLTLQDNYLVDHSSSGHSITNNGGVTFEPESPFSNSTYPLSGEFYSGYFDGSDYLETASSNDFAFSNGDFTYEAWIYPTTFSGGSKRIFYPSANKDALTMGGNSTTYGAGTLSYWNGFAQVISSTGVISTNEWTHVAVTRDGSTVRIFVNGKLDTSGTISHANNNASTSMRVGGNSSDSTYFTGYISNARVVKGTALYTSDFTVPSEPLTAVSGTKLLTLQNDTIQDNSASNHSITDNGTTVAEIAPFGAKLIDRAGSMYFDGSGDYLNCGSNSEFAFNTGQFTVEAWVYSNGTQTSNACPVSCGSSGTGTNTWQFDANNPASPNKWYFILGNSSSTSVESTNNVTHNQWTHIAVSRDSNNVVRLFIDGVLNDTATITNNLNATGPLKIGTNRATSVYFDGYIADVRVIKGTALYTSSFTPPTAPLQPITNTKLLLSGNNGGAEDSLGKANCETNGNIAIDTSVKKFGVGSFEGGNSTGDYLLFPDDPKWDLSGGVYTVEGWVYPKSTTSNIGIVMYSGTQCGWSTSNAMSYVFFIEKNGTLKFNVHTGSSTYSGLSSSSGSITFNAWNYVAAVGNGSNYSLFVNGSRVDTDTTTKPHPPNGMAGLSVGGMGFAVGCNPTGNAYYDDLRITKGVARYDPTQTTHTVPTKTHPTV